MRENPAKTPREVRPVAEIASTLHRVRTSSSDSKPWWRTTPTTVLAVIGFAGAVAALAPLVSEPARDFYAGQGLLGWLLAAIATLGGTTLCIEVLRRWSNYKSNATEAEVDLRATHVNELETAREDARRDALSVLGRERHEHLSDIEVTAEILGGFARGGEMRDALRWLPGENRFSYALSRAAEHTLEAFALEERTVFDPQLRQLLNQVDARLAKYWRTLSNVLDGPSKLDGATYELIVLQPPGGDWASGTGSSWNNYYEFVNALTRLRLGFLESLSPVDRRLQELEVAARRD